MILQDGFESVGHPAPPTSAMYPSEHDTDMASSLLEDPP